MSNNYAFRSGQRKLVKLACASSAVIEVGDMLYRHTDGTVKPASEFTWDTSLAVTQTAFADVFVGIAAEQHLVAASGGMTDEVLVDTSPDSLYAYPVVSGTYIIGDLLGPDKASGNALLDQNLETVATANLAVAVVREPLTTAGTTVRVSFISAYDASSANLLGSFGG